MPIGESKPEQVMSTATRCCITAIGYCIDQDIQGGRRGLFLR